VRTRELDNNVATVQNVQTAGCVKVKRKFHYKIRNRNLQMIKYCRVEQGGYNDGRRLDI